MTIEINTHQVITALNHLMRNATDMRPAFTQIGKTIQNHITLDLGVGRNPWGQAFAPLKKPRKRQTA